MFTHARAPMVVPWGAVHVAASWTMRRLAAGVLLFTVLATACGDGNDSTTPTTVRAPEVVDALIDGEQSIDGERREALAALARDRALLGARWLAGTVRDDGSYHYWYLPVTDEFDDSDYNEVRHAGVTYALFQAYGENGDESLSEAGDAAAEWIEAQSLEADVGRHFHLAGRTKLGGQALAVVALLERRRATGATDLDGLIDDLAAFMLSMERDDHPGMYWMSYELGERLSTPDSLFYPGEALLALTRLARAFPERTEYLDAAVRAAEYLVHERDGDIPQQGDVPRDDHWLTIALSDLYRLAPDDDYATVVYLQGTRMTAAQYTADHGRPGLIGANALRDPVNYTSTATKGEALVAAWALAEHRDDQELSPIFAEAARRTAQFALRVQYTAENTGGMADPAATIGAWPQDPEVESVRIDFVQHNVSMLLGVWWITDSGDLPQAAGSPVEAALSLSRQGV